MLAELEDKYTTYYNYVFVALRALTMLLLLVVSIGIMLARKETMKIPAMAQKYGVLLDGLKL